MLFRYGVNHMDNFTNNLLLLTLGWGPRIFHSSLNTTNVRRHDILLVTRQLSDIEPYLLNKYTLSLYFAE